MKHLARFPASSLALSPVGIAVQLPGGLRLGDANAELRLQFPATAWAWWPQAMGEIGHVGTAIVEGRVLLQGSMRQLMAAAAALLHSDPARDEQTRWWRRVLLRARSMAAHTRSRDARHIARHYDLSDEFYALWLDPAACLFLRLFFCRWHDAGPGAAGQA